MTIQTTLFLLLICVITPAILALNQSNPETLANDRSLRYTSDVTYYGQVPIYYYGEGVMCTGSHVKPWILLTVGSCIVGRNRKLLYVHVSVDMKLNLTKSDVKVLKYEIHPNRTSEKYEYDFALLIIDLPFTWIGGRHHMPDHDYSPDELRKLKVIVSEWQCDKYHAYSRVSNILPIIVEKYKCYPWERSNFGNAYCMYREGQSYTYGQIDWGNPIFYFYNATYKVLLGIYMGHETYGMRYWYHKVWPVRDWVINFMDRHPRPPRAKSRRSPLIV